MAREKRKEKEKMKMKDKLRRKLIWKYFWRRKRQETWKSLKKYWILYLLIIWGFSGITGAIVSASGSGDINAGIYIFFGGAMSIMVAALGAIIFLIIKNFIKWIRSNWEWATEDADIEMRRLDRR